MCVPCVGIVPGLNVTVLLFSVQQMCRVPLDMAGGVRACDLVDPYAVVLLVDGTVVLLELCEGGEGGEGEGEEEQRATLLQTWPEIVQVREIWQQLQT